MIAVPTTTASILGTPSGEPEYNEHGDPIPDSTPWRTGVPIAIATGREVVATESDQGAVVVRYFTGRVPYGTPVTDAQRIRDERTGDIYVIDNVTDPPNAAMPQDLRLDLRRVT